MTLVVAEQYLERSLKFLLMNLILVIGQRVLFLKGSGQLIFKDYIFDVSVYVLLCSEKMVCFRVLSRVEYGLLRYIKRSCMESHSRALSMRFLKKW